MHTSWKSLLVVGTALFAAAPASAQRAPTSGLSALLMNKSVQQELKLSDEDAAKAKEAVAKVMANHKEEFAKLKDLPADEQPKKRASLNRTIGDETLKALMDILTTEQLKRLRQIEIQQVGVGVLMSSDMRKALKLTDMQRDKIKTMRDDYVKERAALQKSKDADIAEKLNKLRKESLDKAVALLTEEQKKAWHDEVGPSFDLKVEAKPGKKPKE